MKLHKASNVEVVRVNFFCSNLLFPLLNLHAKLNSFEKVLYSYGIGFFYVLIGEILFDNFIEAFYFWLKVSDFKTFSFCFPSFPFFFQFPIETYGYAFIFSLTGYMGINVVLHLVKHFGALLAVTGKRDRTRMI